MNIDEHLQRTSRTFALAIPLLPEPTRRKVALAYLLFRVADSLEDGELWSHPARARALDDFNAALAQPERARELAASWALSPPTAHEGYVALLVEFPGLLAAIAELDAASQTILLSHASRTAEGMMTTLLNGRERGRLVLNSLAELRSYCYIVAGIVGELLTALFLHDVPELSSVRDVLIEHQLAFGEGLQLVNVLKDRVADAGAGRVFIPASVSSAEVLALARRDLDSARVYVEALRRAGAPAGIVAFTDLSATLATATLDVLEGPGSSTKISRAEVQRIYASIKPARTDQPDSKPPF